MTVSKERAYTTTMEAIQFRWDFKAGLTISDDKYEYIFPDILIDKNLYQNESFGVLDLQSNYKVNNYDTNKTTASSGSRLRSR